jgi:hypothetical protein
MRVSSNHILSFRHVALAVCFVLSVVSGAQAQTPDNDRAWTTIGSAGSVDEADVSKVFFENSKVQMGQIPVIQVGAKKRRIIGQQTQSAVIRYNVTAVDGLFTPMPGCRTELCPGPQLSFRYIADGPSARVVVKLIEVDLATGVEAVRLTIDSAVSSPGKGYRTDFGAPACDARWRFDFKKKAFYIEARLTTNSLAAVGSVAGIQMIKIDFVDCLN